MKYKVTITKDDKEYASWEDTSKTRLSVKLRANIKLQKSGVNVDDYDVTITEIGEEDDDG